MKRTLSLAAVLAGLLVAGAGAAFAAQAPPTPPPPDTVKPVLTAVFATPKAATAADGAKVTFTLSEDANVAGAVFAHRSGFLVEGRCRLDAKQRAAGKHRKARAACAKLVRIGSFFAAMAVKGVNVAKLGLKTLKPERYQLVLTPRDRTGNLGKDAKLEFEVLKA